MTHLALSPSAARLAPSAPPFLVADRSRHL
jgi:hypothetical protein